MSEPEKDGKLTSDSRPDDGDAAYRARVQRDAIMRKQDENVGRQLHQLLATRGRSVGPGLS